MVGPPPTPHSVVVDHAHHLPLEYGQHVQLYWTCGNQSGHTSPLPVDRHGAARIRHVIALRAYSRSIEGAGPVPLHLCLQEVVRGDVNRVLEKWALELGDAAGRLGIASAKGITLVVELASESRTSGSPGRDRSARLLADLVEMERQAQQAQQELCVERERCRMLQERLSSLEVDGGMLPFREHSSETGDPRDECSPRCSAPSDVPASGAEHLRLGAVRRPPSLHPLLSPTTDQPPPLPCSPCRRRACEDGKAEAAPDGANLCAAQDSARGRSHSPRSHSPRSAPPASDGQGSGPPPSDAEAAPETPAARHSRCPKRHPPHHLRPGRAESFDTSACLN
eukprot:EG_transcript_18159